MAKAKKNQNKKTGHGDKMGVEEKRWQAGDVAMQDLTLIFFQKRREPSTCAWCRRRRRREKMPNQPKSIDRKGTA
jgi:hypothetical protein